MSCEDPLNPHDALEGGSSSKSEGDVETNGGRRPDEGETTEGPGEETALGTPNETDIEPAAAEEEEAPAPPPAHEAIRGAVEAVLYAAGEPLSLRDLKKILPEVPPEDIKQCLEELLELYRGEGRGLHIIEVAGGYQITTRPEFHERVSSLFQYKPPSRLSIQALETLATIAYRQPVTIPEIQELRGVRSASVIRTLLEKKLIRIVGRKNVVGRPVLYGTSKEFLLRFGLKDLGELPSLEDMAEVFGEEVALDLEGFGREAPSNSAPAGESATEDAPLSTAETQEEPTEDETSRETKNE